MLSSSTPTRLSALVSSETRHLNPCFFYHAHMMHCRATSQLVDAGPARHGQGQPFKGAPPPPSPSFVTAAAAITSPSPPLSCPLPLFCSLHHALPHAHSLTQSLTCRSGPPPISPMSSASVHSTSLKYRTPLPPPTLHLLGNLRVRARL
jgi:hypothetical protein